MTRSLLFCFAMGGLMGCGDPKPADESSTDTLFAQDTGECDTENTQSCGDIPGYDDACGDPTYEPVGWDELLGTSVTPAELFSPLEGECTSAFTWNAAAFNTNAIKPESGESQMNVLVVFDRQSVRIGHYDENASGGGDSYCPEFVLEATAHVSLTTEDGVFSDSGEITVTAGLDSQPLIMFFDVPLEQHQGSLQIVLGDEESGALHYRFGGAAASCIGEVNLSIDMELGQGESVSAEGRIGQWSSTSCGLNETEVDLTATLPSGRTALEEIERTWGDATYTGTWDDGKKTVLNVSLETTETTACRTNTTTLVPVQMRYGTTDGRITEATAAATVDVSFASTGDVRSMQLWLSDDMNCASPSDVIPYTLKSCATLEGVTIQLGITEESNGQLLVSDEGMMVYEYYRGGSAPSGGADHVTTMAISRN